MQSLIMLFAILLGVFGPVSGTNAAPAMKHAECVIVGTLMKTEERVEERDPDWAASWGLPPSVTYLDATIRLTRSDMNLDDGYNNCADKTGEQIFQIRDDWQDWYRTIEPGTCLQSRSRFGGDEFSIGDWLFDSAQIEAAACGP